ncbi:Inner membrane protein YbaN [compost metagenome]
MIGAVVPGMPTTVFILMAGWAAMRSSPRFHAWLYAHAMFGPMLRSWDDGGRVSRRVKWLATLSMSASSVLIVYLSSRPWLAGLALASMACVLVWLWLRPEPEA